MNAFKGFLVASALMAGGAIFPSATLAQTGSVGPPQLEAGQSMGRALGIASVPNLRDVGGYRTDDDGIVARGLVYRSDTLTGVNDADYKPPFPLTAKMNKLTIKVDRPQLTEEEAKKLENKQAIAVDGNPIHHVQGGPH